MVPTPCTGGEALRFDDASNPPTEGDTPELSAPTILLADDSPLVRRMLERLFTEAGFTVLTAQDGLEAVEKAFQQEIDVFVLDVTMPRMTGYQVCRILKSEVSTQASPVVLLTSHDQLTDRAWGHYAGADHYLTKDQDPARIVAFVNGLVQTPRAPTSPTERRAQVDVLARVNELLDRKLYETTLLSEIGKVARSLASFDETFATVMQRVAQAVDYAVGAFAFAEGEELEVILGLAHPVSPVVVERARAFVLDSVARHQGEARFTRIESHTVAIPAPERTVGRSRTDLERFEAFPVHSGGRLAGLLAVGGGAVRDLDPQGRQFLAEVASLGLTVLENSRLFARVRDLSTRDSLTGLLNHRYILDALGREFERATRYGDALSLLMLDVDHFKQVNDVHGHQAGDSVLRGLARLLGEQLRGSDTIGRYGGEEFAALLPRTGSVEACQTAERIRQRVAAHAFRGAGEDLKLTVSIGVTTYPSPTCAVPGDLVRLADLALYRAKGEGRNRVEVEPA
jgi:two-component system cell cycle response regulator